MPHKTFSVLLGILSKVFLVLSVVVISKHISLDEFGWYEIATTSINLLFPILCAGSIDGIFRFCIDESGRKVVFSRLVLFGCLVFLILSPIVFLLLSFYFDFVVSVLILSLIFFNIILESIKQLKKSQGLLIYFTGAESLKSFSFLIFILAAAYSGSGFKIEFLLYMQVISVLVTLFVVSFLSSIWNEFVFQKEILRINKDELKYSLYMMPNTVLWWVLNASDKIILGILSGPASVAIYSVATKFPSLITSLNRIFMQLWHVAIVGGKGKIENLWKVNMALLNISFITLAVIFYFSFDLIFDKRYSQASDYVQWLLVGSYYSVLSSLLGGIFMRDKKPKVALYSTLIAAILNVALNIFFIPIYGVIGCVFSTVLSLAVLFFLRLLYITVRNLEPIGFFWAPITHPCILIFPYLLTNGFYSATTIISSIILIFTVRLFVRKIS
ncbi:polysaccharide biosynthesis C-terminal domain-containing protein [Pseudoalteromonas sp. SCSIO 43088]|uniref:lipopolysaccharide biosynthesis protein n=1 Tax=Pseudoalteromonas sp. SCSIO 43088 TaxID=2822846 RepID=UPI00202B7A58|nr:polysaccharide biosynthesis C-terminal domain-containing protein [Pseudoalteromonas sp. SCSIO 43088]URQ86601.1 polysaccharide biosynthesis C-terminal domain-containing protein [Pseudoalteromonas sp. SCSIO 43088]